MSAQRQTKMMKAFTSHPKLPLVCFGIVVFALWIAGKLYSPPLSTASLYSGEPISPASIGQLVTAEGNVTKTWRNKQGMRFLTVKGQQGKFGVSFFPSLGKLPYIPREGDMIRVAGLLDTYKDKPQISPLSSQAVVLVENTNSQQSFSNSSLYPTVNVSELSSYMGQTVWIQSIRATSAERFTSRKGSKMLRFEAVDSNGKSVQGIFFEGDWDDRTVEILSSQREFQILAKVGEFRGDVSLQAKQLKF